ncbi:hypothetical protein [Compostibacter hankyongensis]|uniref:Tetratricopeptide repeat protein n=1 Tax=Compostibacter hankyongensis TaxID=1007089 RepID=A0ABP8FTR0_9BACT
MIRRLFLLYRLPLGILLLLAGILVTYTTGILISWILFLLALICIFTHFFLGPLGLAQTSLEQGDMEGAEAVLKKVQFPGLLYKPIRATYYFLKSIIATTRQDLENAEAYMKKSISIGVPMKEVQAQAYFQLGSISFQRSNVKQADEYLKKAVNIGLPDNESRAAAYLQLASIAMTRRDFRNVRLYHKKCKEQKPTTPEVVQQLKELDRYIPRMPGTGGGRGR